MWDTMWDTFGVQVLGVIPGTAAAEAAETTELRELREQARWANVATIQAIPASQLPEGPARALLLALAEAGCDVYAYTPCQYLSTDAEARWNVWVETERFSAPEWQNWYDAMLLRARQERWETH